MKKLNSLKNCAMPYWRHEWWRPIVRPRIPWRALYKTNLKGRSCLQGSTGGTVEDSSFSVLSLQMKRLREWIKRRSYTLAGLIGIGVIYLCSMQLKLTCETVSCWKQNLRHSSQGTQKVGVAQAMENEGKRVTNKRSHVLLSWAKRCQS